MFADAARDWHMTTLAELAAAVARGRRGLLQPAVKCRGREYLRIIYGPNYTAEEHLSLLRERGLSNKRALARAGLRAGRQPR